MIIQFAALRTEPQKNAAGHQSSSQPWTEASLLRTVISLPGARIVVTAISPSQRRHGDNSERTNYRRTRHDVVGQNAPPKVQLIRTRSQGMYQQRPASASP
jgi:hypothetical protein